MRINRRVLICIVVMCLLNSLPYLIALFAAPSGTTFSGVSGSWVDYNSHLAKMQQGYRGDWLYQILFTTEPHQPALLQTFYVALGHLARITGLSLAFTYHLARVICTALMCWAIWAFLRHYFEEKLAWWAFLLTLFSGGLGVLLFVLAPAMTAEVSPIEFWLLDGYNFLASLSFPHFAAGIALLALSMLMVERWAQGKSGSLLILLLTTLGIGIVQPFDLPLMDAVLFVVICWRVFRRQHDTKLTLVQAVIGGLLLGIAHAALLSYDFIFLYGEPVWRDFTVQNVTLSPAPIYYLFGYAPLLIPTLLAIAHLINRTRRATPQPSTSLLNERLKVWDRWVLPIVWIAFVAVLLYAPLNTQRRYTMGIQLPLTVLTVYWFVEVGIPALRRRFRRRWVFPLIVYGAISTFSTLLVLQMQIFVFAHPTDRVVYLSDDMEAGWQWLRDNTYPYDTVLGSFQSGGQLVAQTGRRTVLGHWIETVDYEHKRAEVTQFFDPQVPDQWRWTFMSQQGISYIWYGDEERKLGAWLPTSIKLLNPVFESPTVTIYRVDWVR
jgi:hypothetical protein